METTIIVLSLITIIGLFISSAIANHRICTRAGILLTRLKKLKDVEVLYTSLEENVRRLELMKTGLHPFYIFKFETDSMNLDKVEQFADKIEDFYMKELTTTDHTNLISRLKIVAGKIEFKFENGDFMGREFNKKQLEIIARAKNNSESIGVLLHSSEKLYLKKLFVWSSVSLIQLELIDIYV